MKKRGISLTSLTIGIVILLILLSTVSISITYSINNAKKRTFAEEIYNLQSVVNEYIKKEETLPLTTAVLQVEISDTAQFTGETITDGKVTLEEVDLVELRIKNTVYGTKEDDAKDVYAISGETGRVYYVAGFKSGDKTYYTLTDELLEMVEDSQNLTISENSITFTPSTVGWSSEGISVVVTVPSEYESSSIEIDNANIVFDTTTQDGATIYTVNTGNLAEEYTVTVNYTKNGTTGTATYSAKIDKTAPVISKDANISNTTTHIKGLNATDAESGIKYFKYVEGAIDNDSNIKAYMHEYGKNINNGSIKFENKIAYTLYAEDKAGNYSVIYIDVWENMTSTKPDDRIIVPLGFTPSIYSGEMTVDEGFVIYETDDLTGLTQETAMTTYNQYVWVPVPDVDEFVRRDGYYIGALQTLVSTGNATEPFSKTSDDGITLSISNDLTEEYAEYVKMKASVERNDGFYIARYEAGKEGTDTLVSKKGATAWNSIPWGTSMTEIGTSGAVYRARNVYPESANKEVVSTLIYGVQWDAVMNFMKDIQNANVPGKTYMENGTEMGWYSDNYADGNASHKTGINVDENASNMVKNIYDMAGNFWEWTMEALSTNLRVLRGGYYALGAASHPASLRSDYRPDGAYEYYSFRVALYLK